MRAIIVLALGLGIFAGCGDKEGPPPSPGVNKREVQNRADSVHDDLKDEEERSKRRKEQ